MTHWLALALIAAAFLALTAVCWNAPEGGEG